MTNIKQSMQSKIQLVTEIFLKYSKIFHDCIATLPTAIETKDGYSFVLLHIYQSMIMQDFPTIEMLAEKNLYVSAAKITRSMLEATNIVLYLYNLEPPERELATKSFTDFQGSGDWLKTLSDNSVRKMLISNSLDKEIASFGFIDNNGKDMPLTGYDFLSKITHYNPKLLQNIIGITINNDLAYRPDYVNVCILVARFTIATVIFFFIIFCQHFKIGSEKQHEELSFILRDFNMEMNEELPLEKAN